MKRFKRIAYPYSDNTSSFNTLGKFRSNNKIPAFYKTMLTRKVGTNSNQRLPLLLAINQFISFLLEDSKLAR